MKVDLKALRTIPMLMMVIFALYISVSFNSVGIQAASYILLGLTLISFAFSAILIIRNDNIPILSMAVLSLMMLIEVISILTSMEWKDWLYYTLSLLLLTFLFHYYKHDLTPLISGAAIGFSIAVYMQFYQCIAHPEMWMLGTDRTNAGYILGGNYNSIGPRILCALLTCLLCLRISRKWFINLIPLCICSLLILFMIQSMTSVTCIILFLVLCIIPNTRIQHALITLIIFATILFEFFVCLQGKGFENNEIARWFIIDILGKDMTFTHRTDMWDSALQAIYASPLYGYGNPTEQWFYSKMSSFAYGPHNFFLGVMINGGILAVMLFGIIIIISLTRIYKMNSRFSNVVYASISTLAIMMLMEYYPFQFPIFLLTIAYYYRYFELTTAKQHLQ